MKARSRDRLCHTGNISRFNSCSESSNMSKKECLWFQENKPLEVVFPRDLLTAMSVCLITVAFILRYSHTKQNDSAFQNSIHSFFFFLTQLEEAD